ncbi:PKD domain-containing protein [Deinococcus sp. AJ005]|uniref:PKD domain-containing protein n=1 Tax=Deinococcus sp. AJ005 TaxID=2652443 RepID=UPI00125CB11E|nr:PKD domain-containing protein [Deinococcus sp. AJ005]QFP75586.1 PKD domain-containing protein [Deinococcus sp. AJ005]
MYRNRLSVGLGILLSAALLGCGNHNIGTPTPTPTNVAPVAAFALTGDAFTASGASAFKTVKLDATTSSDPNGDALTYRWDLGDGNTATGPVVSTSYPGGAFTVKLTVTDPGGLSNAATQTRTYTQAAATGSADVKVKVVDTGGTPLSGVVVTLSGNVGTTDALGVAQVSGDTGRLSLLKVARAGFMTQTVQTELKTGAANATIQVTLRPLETVQTLNAATGGTLSAGSGASVTVPANAFVDSSGNAVTGMVQAMLTPITGADVTFPGHGEALSAAGTRANLFSYGMLDVQFAQGTQKLQLAPGKTAQLLLDLNASKHPDGSPINVGDSIPTWWFNGQVGLWIEESAGQVIASATAASGKALKMTVNHFTTWNWDAVYNGSSTTLAVKCMHLDGGGNPTVALAVGETCHLTGFIQLPGSNGMAQVWHDSYIDSTGVTAMGIPTGMVVTLTGTANGMSGAATTTTGSFPTLASPLIIPLNTVFIAPPPSNTLAFLTPVVSVTDSTGALMVNADNTLTVPPGSTPTFTLTKSGIPQPFSPCNFASLVLPCLQSATETTLGQMHVSVVLSGNPATYALTATLGAQTASYTISVY